MDCLIYSRKPVNLRQMVFVFFLPLRFERVSCLTILASKVEKVNIDISKNLCSPVIFWLRTSVDKRRRIRDSSSLPAVSLSSSTGLLMLISNSFSKKAVRFSKSLKVLLTLFKPPPVFISIDQFELV